MLSCSIWFSVPSFWMGGGLESGCIGRVYGADGAVRANARSNNPQNKTQYMVSSNAYMFRYRGAIFRESTKIKAHKSNTSLVIVCVHRLPVDCTLVPKHVAVGN